MSIYNTICCSRCGRELYRPCIAAQIFILKNRRSDWWREKQIIEMKNDGMLEQLIDGLKEPTDEVIETVEEAETINEADTGE